MPEAKTKSWWRTSGTTITWRWAAWWFDGFRAAAGLSAARLIVALTRRPAAATAVRRGSVRIRPDTARESEALKMRITPLMGEVDDVGGERRAASGRERHRAGRLRSATAERRADDSLRAVVVGGVPAIVEAVDAYERARVGRVDEVAVADVDPDVVELVEEDKIARLELV